jgi:hypothetical protein
MIDPLMLPLRVVILPVEILPSELLHVAETMPRLLRGKTRRHSHPVTMLTPNSDVLARKQMMMNLSDVSIWRMMEEDLS